MDRVALLRAVNVGGRGQVAMTDLRALFEDLHLGPVRTLLQSGNVVFTGGRKTAAQLERLLESETAKRFGLRTEYFVRSAADLRKIVEGNPFAREAKSDPGRVVVFFLKEPADRTTASALRASYTGPEVFEAAGPHVYIYYPEGQGRSKFKVPWLGTARNWNTVTKLLAAVE
jgi:uncharacterized protein (DUF1697 family)